MTGALLVALLAVGMGQESAHGPWSLQEVAEKVVARQAGLHRLFVDVYMTTQVNKRSQTDRHVVAFAPKRCFVDFMHLTGPGDSPWHDNARFQLWLTNEQIQSFQPFTRTWLPKAPIDLKEYWKSPYGQAIGWHPQAEVFESERDRLFYLDDVLAAGQLDRIRVVGQAEEIDGTETVILETIDQSDRLWFAPKYGFALVKRVKTRRDNHRTHQLAYRCRNFQETDGHIWLPWKVEAKSSEILHGTHRPLRSFLLEVTRLYVNSAVPDAVFEFSAPPGTLTIQEENPIAFEGGGEDLLDLWCAVCATALLPRSPRSIVSWQVMFAVIIWILSAVAIMLYLFRARHDSKQVTGGAVD